MNIEKLTNLAKENLSYPLKDLNFKITFEEQNFPYEGNITFSVYSEILNITFGNILTLRLPYKFKYIKDIYINFIKNIDKSFNKEEYSDFRNSLMKDLLENTLIKKDETVKIKRTKI